MSEINCVRCDNAFVVICFKQCIIKQLLDSVFVISEIIKVSVSVISLTLWLRLITLTSTLIIPDITKTLSDNCLLIGNKTSCRPIRSVIVLVINKSDSRCVVVRFCYHSYDYRPNWTPLSPITITYYTQNFRVFEDHMTSRFQGLFPPSQFRREKPWKRGCYFFRPFRSVILASSLSFKNC